MDDRQQSIPTYAAGDLIAAEIRARMIGGVDDALAGFDPTNPQLVDALRESVIRYARTAEDSINALARGIGRPFPGPDEATIKQWASEAIDTLQRGLTDRLYAYSQSLCAEIDRVHAESDAIQAEMQRMVREGKGKRWTKKREAIMRGLGNDAEACLRKLWALNTKLDAIKPKGATAQ